MYNHSKAISIPIYLNGGCSANFYSKYVAIPKCMEACFHHRINITRNSNFI